VYKRQGENACRGGMRREVVEMNDGWSWHSS
jgi:hypothetical protein